MPEKLLNKKVQQFAKDNFPEIFATILNNLFYSFLERINTKKGALWVLPITIIFFILGQFFKPHFLQIIPIDALTVTTIIDQRISNIATIFSITLVITGWLITHISIKESISLRFLFKNTYLYPIFYFTISLIGILMLMSLFRNQKIINMGDIIVTGTYLILIALVSITLLFTRLIVVVDPKFFFDSLNTEVLKEAKNNAKATIISRLGKKYYDEVFQQLGFSQGPVFGTNLQYHSGIEITPTENTQTTADSQDKILFPDLKYMIKNVNLKKVFNLLSPKQFKEIRYYQPLSINTGIQAGYCPIYLHITEEISKKDKDCLKSAYKLKKYKPQPGINNFYLEHLNDRLMKAVKDGKTEIVETILKIYDEVYEIEQKILKLC